jgi:transcriptional regulator with XRE-family HTH domain
MNQNPTATATTTEVPLHILLRRRREELSLFQAQIAETLHVTPECIGQWECGRRRMELNKLPRIAAALQLDARQLCAQALAEFHPSVYAALFGPDAAPANTQQVAACIEVESEPGRGTRFRITLPALVKL